VSAQALEARLAHLEGAFGQMDRRLETLEHVVIEGFKRVDTRFDQVEARFSLIDRRFNWLIGIVVASWISTIVTVLFHR
jgi:uncharacterized coiled-coil protein SlyX